MDGGLLTRLTANLDAYFNEKKLNGHFIQTIILFYFLFPLVYKKQIQSFP